jgi:hypothetical protein
MKPEVVQGLPAHEYHDRKDYLSNSMLSHFLRSPAHLQAYLRNPPEPTKALTDGTMIHDAILEPEMLSKKYVASPDVNNHPGALVSADDLKAKCKDLGLPVSGTKSELSKRILEKAPNTPIWDQIVQSYAEKHAGKTFIKGEDLRSLERLVESVYSHEAASQILKNGVAESSIFWEDKETGVKCRCRPDYYVKDGGILIDVKSTEDARASTFQKSLYTFGYYRQLAFYALGLEAAGLPVTKCRIIAVEKSEPYAVSVFEVDSTTIHRGFHDVFQGLRRYAECLKSDNWPAYSEQVEIISLPTWAF